MRYIYITEHNIRQMVVESVRQLITESKQTRKAKSDMTGIAKELKGLDQEQARPVIDKFLQDVFHTITLDNKYTSKYAPPLFKLYLTGEMGGDDKGHDVIAYLFQKCSENEGFVLDPKELNVSAFNQILKEIENAGKNSLNKANQVERTGNSGYEIRRDLTFEQAHEIGNYSYPGLKLCYTQYKSTWNEPRYSNNGRNICYVLLKKGWKELEPVHDNGSTGGDGSPYDTYGMSMIFLFVGPDGRLVSSNTRWNHNADWGSKDCDQAFTEEMISNLIGAPFSEEFPCIDPDVRKANKMRDIEQRLANGEKPEDIFDYVSREYEGFRTVKLNGLWNYLTKDNKILCKDWFKQVRLFQNGFARVERDDYRYNVIKSDGTYLTDMWFESVLTSVNDELWYVELTNNNWNYLKKDGTLLCKDIEYNLSMFHGNYAVATKLGSFMLIDKEGNMYDMTEHCEKLLNGGKDPYEIFSVNEEHEGFRVFQYDNLYNYLTKDNKILCKDWFYFADNFKNGFSCCMNPYNHFNFVKPDGTYLSDMWFEWASDFSETGISRVELTNRNRNFLKKDGKLAVDDLDCHVSAFRGRNVAEVRKNGEFLYYINRNGERID